MDLLEEIRAVRQNRGERKRRWFTSVQMDLYVWFGWWGAPVKFQLCYNKHRQEKVLTWSKANGYSHENIDPGEPAGVGHKATAILVNTATAVEGSLGETFAAASINVPDRIRCFVLGKL